MRVVRIAFDGNERFSDEELALRVRTRANRRFLSIPGFTWWLWMYQLGESGALGERIGDALMAGGEPPALFDAGVLAADVERLKIFYRQEGFREADVHAVVDTLDRGKLRVTFRIEPGSPTYIRQVRYAGVDHLTPEQQYRLSRETLLRSERISQEAPLSFLARNQRYSEPTLLEERRRLLSFLRDEGYAAMTRDSIRALIFRPSPDSFDITFRIRTGERYRFGDVDFVVMGPEADVESRAYSTELDPPAAGMPGGRATFSFENESKVSPALLTRTLHIQPGAWYSQSDVLATKRRLEGSGVFLFTDIIPNVSDTVHVLSGGPPRLPHRIELRTRPRHQIRLETFMLQRSGVLGSSDTELGTGAGVTYENANLLGRGEAFRIRSTGSLSANIDSTLFTGAQAEISTSLTYPYLVGPFGHLESMLSLYDARTHFSLSLLTARHDRFRLIIRGRGNARYRMELRHSPTLTSYVDLIDISVSNPDTLTGFRTQILEELLRPVLDPVQQAQIIEDYTVPQINTALRYTLRSSSVNPLRRDRGYSHELTMEVGNNLPYLLDRFVYSPGTVEGSLPGLPFFREEGSGSRLAYRQYARLVGDLRSYTPLSGNTVLGLKFTGGFAHPIGASDVVPFDRRFYAGGASSVRGWSLRDLGPGGARFTSAEPERAPRGTVTNVLGGDIKLEGSVELRHTVLRSLFAADWIGVLFADAGNVWFGPRNPGLGEDAPQSSDGRFGFDTFYREIGVGSGFGIRAAWDYLIVRFDLGFKVYDPSRPYAGLLPDGLRSIQPHFGLGHTF